MQYLLGISFQWEMQGGTLAVRVCFYVLLCVTGHIAFLTIAIVSTLFVSSPLLRFMSIQTAQLLNMERFRMMQKQSRLKSTLEDPSLVRMIAVSVVVSVSCRWIVFCATSTVKQRLIITYVCIPSVPRKFSWSECKRHCRLQRRVD